MAFRDADNRNSQMLEICHHMNQSPTEADVFAELLRLLPQAHNAKDKFSLLRLLVAYLKCHWILDKIDNNPNTLNLLRTGDNQVRNTISNDSVRPVPNSTLATSLDKEDELRRALSDINLVRTGMELHDQSSDIQHKNLETYKENLLKGMQEFLGPMPLDLEGLTLGRSTDTGHINVRGSPTQSHGSNSGNKAKPDTEVPANPLRRGRKNDNKRCPDRKEEDKEAQKSKSDFSFRLDKLPPISFEGSLMLEAAAGFLMILDSNLDIVSTSENVSQYLGYSQFQLIGQHVYTLLHAEDVPLFKMHAEQKGTSTDVDIEFDDTKKTFYMDLKYRFYKGDCRFTGSSLYQWNVRLILCRDNRTGSTSFKGMVCLCRQMNTNYSLCFPHQSNVLTLIESLDFTIIKIEPSRRCEELTGYSPSDVLHVNNYQFKHPCDVYTIRHAHEMCLAHGESDSGYCRYINKLSKTVWFFCRFRKVEARSANRPSYIHTTFYTVGAKEAENALCRDEEEYKRFKCQGFGRIYETKYKNQPHRSSNLKGNLSQSFQTGFNGDLLNTSTDCRSLQSASCSRTTHRRTKRPRTSQTFDGQETNHSVQLNHNCLQSYSYNSGSSSPDIDLRLNSQSSAEGSPANKRTIDSDSLSPQEFLTSRQSCSTEFLKDFDFLKGDYCPQVEEIHSSIEIVNSGLTPLDVCDVYETDISVKNTERIPLLLSQTVRSPHSLMQTNFDIPQLDADTVDQTLNTLEMANISPLNCRNTDSLSEEDSFSLSQVQLKHYNNKKCSSCRRCEKPKTALCKLLEEEDDRPTSPKSNSSMLSSPSPTTF